MPVLRFVLTMWLAHAAVAAAPCADLVCVEVESTARTVTFYAVSRAEGVSVVFSVSAVNMKPSSHTVTQALRCGRTELVTLTALPGKKTTFEHAFFLEWGITDATHDDRVSYRLPFETGRQFRLSQGPYGSLSHQGKFAYDFPMPSGTPVCAARDGVVTEVVDGFEEGGADEKFREMANRISIVHDDGTFAEYMHLQRGSMRVQIGDRIEAGAVIGLSGNSGWSTGPHLHLEVWRRTNAVPRETLPVTFLTAGKAGVVLETGKSYRAD